MIDKEKLIETIESSESEISREQIDWLCENADKYVGKFVKPYEISIDFGPLFVGIFAQLTDLASRLTLVEVLVKSISEAHQKESAESIESVADHTESDCAKS